MLLSKGGKGACTPGLVKYTRTSVHCFCRPNCSGPHQSLSSVYVSELSPSTTMLAAHRVATSGLFTVTRPSRAIVAAHNKSARLTVRAAMAQPLTVYLKGDPKSGKLLDCKACSFAVDYQAKGHPAQIANC